MKYPVTIYLDEGEGLAGIYVRPVAAEMSEKLAQELGAKGKTNKGTAKVTYSGGETDAEADVTFDF